VQIHHLAFRTDDVSRLASFYTDVLGFTVTRHVAGPHARVWLRAGESLLMIEPREAGEPTIAPASMELVAFRVSPSTRAALEQKLEAAGTAIEGRTAYTSYFRDPDGRRLAISHYDEEA
jgi:catechol 2,3-dioxygenase-like lactoylglutathione lyase family enzyme